MNTMSQQAAVLSGAAGSVRVARGEVTRLCERLTLELQGVQQQWAGDGGRAFQSLVAAWADRQRRIVGALDGLADSLEGTERDTLATDQAQASTTSALHARLG